MTDVLVSICAFLFKYPPEVFRQGRFVFAGVPTLPLVLLAVAVVMVPVVGSYARARGRIRRGDRMALAGLRLGALGVVAFCLTRPALELASAVPQRNFVAILVDDSRSMAIADQQGRPRADLVRGLIAGDSALMQALNGRFQLRFFRFGSTTTRFDDPSALQFSDEWTRLTPAIGRAREELAQVPLAGIVVLTDGAENPAVSLDSLNDLAPAGVPLYIVGIGQEEFERDIEIVDVQSPAAVLQGSAMAVDLTVSQSGYGGRSVRVQAEESGRILSAREVKLDRGKVTSVRLSVPAPEPGTRTLRFSVVSAPDEIITENNRWDAVTTIRRGPERILYYEGEPRFELKFLRRAIADDPNVQLVTLLRTAQNKYLRLGIADSLELVGGFPNTREELFRYQGVILGSVEASALSVEQLRMLADFVSVRGGGLMVLGGRRALAEGGYSQTPLARVLPVNFGDPDTAFFALAAVRPTVAGMSEPALQLLGDDEATAERWRTLPPLSVVNRITGVKPGATTMLQAELGARTVPIMAWQRYGRGKSIGFVVQDSWLWQMHADIPLEDQTHETLWRQLLRWLVRDVPDQVNIALSGERVPPGEAVRIGVNVMNSRYDAVNSDQVTARVTSPSGRISDLAIPWSGTRDGWYEIPFVPDESGRYDVEVESRAGRDTVPMVATTSFTSGDSDAELKSATLQASRLRQMAVRSGGRYYTPATSRSLPQDIALSGSGITVREQRDLWDMPAIFLLLVGMLGGEWFYRRWRGLA